MSLLTSSTLLGIDGYLSSSQIGGLLTGVKNGLEVEAMSFIAPQGCGSLGGNVGSVSQHSQSNATPVAHVIMYQ